MIDYKISPGTAGKDDTPIRYDDLPSHNIEVFQSENIQNILDAKSKNQDSVEIHYEVTKVDAAARSNLRELLGNVFFDKMKESFVKSEAQDIEEQVKHIKLALENEDKWYSLTVTEKNTTGLLGDETGNEKGSNYHALMRHINRSEKQGSFGGGTFGKGSSVYTYSSGLWFWFAYSVLETKWNDTKVRFCGRGMIAPFMDRTGNQSYDGSLWYARPEDEREYINGHPQQGLPYVNANAHIHAQKFGMPKREETEPGTTYLIPVFWPDDITADNMSADEILIQLRREIIKRWFVPIYNEQLKCYIKITGKESEVKLEKEDLYVIPELRHKLEILEWYNKNVDEADKRFIRKRIEVKLPVLKKSQQTIIAKKYGKKIGHRPMKVLIDLVVRELSEEEEDFKGFIESDLGTINRIALLRNKGMIVNHYPYDEALPVEGNKKFEAMLFAGKMSNLPLTDEEFNYMEMFLSFSENPAHNEWIQNKTHKNRCHLNRFEQNPSPYSKVKSIFTRIRLIINEIFPKDDKPPTKKEICSFWRKLCKLPLTGNQGGGKANYSYDTVFKGFDNEGRYSWKLKFTSQNVEKKVKLTFSPYLNSLEGPLKKSVEFANLGVPEFEELYVAENGQSVKNIILEYDRMAEEGIPKLIEIKTCKITGNNIFKNLDPVLEINDVTIT